MKAALDIPPDGLARMTPGEFAFHCAVICLCFDVHPEATIREGLVEAVTQGSKTAGIMLGMIGVSPTPYERAT